MALDTSRIDHLVCATQDLQAGIDTIEAMLGVRPSPGGNHPGWGTRNALLSLGNSCYLEIIGPDVEQDLPGLFRINEAFTPRLVTWAAKCEDLASQGVVTFDDGRCLGEVFPASRQTPDGETLSWHLTDPRVELESGLLPFLIDWGESPHPADSAAAGATLVELRLEHPEPDALLALLGQLQLPIAVSEAPQPALVAIIDCPAGRVELR